MQQRGVEWGAKTTSSGLGRACAGATRRASHIPAQQTINMYHINMEECEWAAGGTAAGCCVGGGDCLWVGGWVLGAPQRRPPPLRAPDALPVDVGHDKPLLYIICWGGNGWGRCGSRTADV